MEKIAEKPASKINGFVILLISFLLLVLDIYLFVVGIQSKDPGFLWIFIPGILIIVLLISGLIVVQPNDSRVIIFFGKYSGTVRQSGFWWVNPFTIKRKISLRIRNFSSEKIKVNDLNGNPIEIGAVIVWKVGDSAKAVF